MTDNERPLYRHPEHAESTKRGTLRYIWTMPDVNVDAYVGFFNGDTSGPIIVFVHGNGPMDWRWTQLGNLIETDAAMGTGSQMTRAMTYHKAKDIIAAMNKYSKVEEACLEYFGERCPDFEPGCPTCEGWLQFDRLIEAAKEKGKK